MKRSLLLFFGSFIVFTFLSYILFQKSCNYAMGNHPAKEIQFNHKTHVVKCPSDCETCHGYYENGRFKGIPTVGTCVSCHDRTAPNSAADPCTPTRKPFLDNYKDSNAPWGAYAAQPDLVYFSHRVVMGAKYEDGRKKARCGSCHGDKAESTTTKKIKGKMLMGQCMDCHTALNIGNKCLVCHD